jgi:hypothetical protein
MTATSTYVLRALSWAHVRVWGAAGARLPDASCFRRRVRCCFARCVPPKANKAKIKSALKPVPWMSRFSRGASMLVPAMHSSLSHALSVSQGIRTAESIHPQYTANPT